MVRGKILRTGAMGLMCMLLLTSCVTPSDSVTSEQTQAPISDSVQTEPVETDAPFSDYTEPDDPSLPQTETPTLKEQTNISSDEVLLYGKTVEDAVIKVRYSDGSVEYTKTDGTLFYVRAKAEKRQTVYISAIADGCRASEEISADVRRDTKANTKVFLGKNSMMYFSETLLFQLGRVTAKEGTLNYVVKDAERKLQRVRELTGKDTRFIYIMCPNPVTVYSEYQYDGIPTEPAQTPTSQLVEKLSGIDGVIVPDMRQIMGEHKDEGIFFKTDTHWSELGAYYAYEAMMTEVLKYSDTAILRTLDEFEQETLTVKGGDMSEMLYVWGIEEEATFLNPKFEQTGDYYTAKREQGKKVAGYHADQYPSSSSNGTNAPTAYFIGDSYGVYLLPYVGMGFSNVFVNRGVLWNYDLDYDKIEQEKPDYVIFCFTERNITADLSMIIAN